jgi:hypothetical protein
MRFIANTNNLTNPNYYSLGESINRFVFQELGRLVVGGCLTEKN